MDQFTRRIVGFAVHRGAVDGLTLRRMFNRAIHGQILPKYLSSDHDPLYRFHQWPANLRVLMVQEIKTVPYVPLSHPFVERPHRDDPSGVLRPNIILDGSRSGRNPPRLPELFQQAPRSFGLKRTAARSRGCGCAVKLCFIPVAEALSRTLSDAYRRVISEIRQGQVRMHKRQIIPAGPPDLAALAPLQQDSRLLGRSARIKKLERPAQECCSERTRK